MIPFLVFLLLITGYAFGQHTSTSNLLDETHETWKNLTASDKLLVYSTINDQINNITCINASFSASISFLDETTVSSFIQTDNDNNQLQCGQHEILITLSDAVCGDLTIKFRRTENSVFLNSVRLNFFDNIYKSSGYDNILKLPVNVNYKCNSGFDIILTSSEEGNALLKLRIIQLKITDFTSDSIKDEICQADSKVKMKTSLLIFVVFTCFLLIIMVIFTFCYHRRNSEERSYLLYRY